MEDSDILKIYKEDGNQEYAFNLLMRKYEERLYWHIRKLTCSHEDTNDLLQNTFIKVWRSLPEFREESKLYTWLYKIATNETLTFLKKKRLNAFLSFNSYDAILERNLFCDDTFNGDKIQMALHKAILKLPDRQKAVFNLRYFQDMKYEDIAEVLGTTVGALKASYHHAYKKITTDLKENI